MNWDLQTLNDLISMWASLTVALGGPAALFRYFRTTKNEKLVIENSAYDSTDQAFQGYQRLCLENPKLDIFDVRDEKPEELTTEEKKKEVIAFTMLFSVFERAHFIYTNYKSLTVSRQWDAWEAYIEDFCSRDNFKYAWKVSGVTFDPEFQKYMKEKHNLE